MNYKNTLLLPKTVMPMRAHLSITEKNYQALWSKSKLYEKLLRKNKNNKPFVLHDGPPYANGSIHLGHALNKIIKDIIVREKFMSGFFAPFRYGWDTHGLPIENQVLKKLRSKKMPLTSERVRSEAATYANAQVALQQKEFAKLSLLVDTKECYLTSDFHYEAKQWEVFKELALKNLFFRAKKPVYWSPSSQTALADAEIIYKTKSDPSVFVLFTIKDNNKNVVKKGDLLIVWTTTPWTLLANAAIAVSPDLNYLLVNHKENNYVVAECCWPRILKASSWKKWKIKRAFLGKKLIGTNYKLHFSDGLANVIGSTHVATDTGSGLVHIAPMFGPEDYVLGKKHNLKMIMHVDDKGNLTTAKHNLKEIFYLKSNEVILKILKTKNLILHLSRIEHQIPHDWRTNKPVIYRATTQWFLNTKKLSKRMVDSLKNVRTKQNWVLPRMKQMIVNREEWCVSRQRTWGTPLPIFYDKNHQPVFAAEVFEHLIKIAKKHGTKIWYEWTLEKLLPSSHHNKGLTQEKDVMDVWFDSGISHAAVNVEGLTSPFQLYLEGSDQYRGWFISSLTTSVACTNKSPFEELVSHGFVLDGKNQKMSKSLGNVISPLDIIKKYGAETLRLWVANSEFFNDVTVSDKIIIQNVEIFRKIRGAMRYILANLFDFNPQKDCVSEPSDIHALFLEELNDLQYKVKRYYLNYQFQKIIKKIHNFLVKTSSFYLEVGKHALYTQKFNSYERRSYQTTIHKILITLVRLLAPILPVTTEEIYNYLKENNKKESVHLTNFSPIAPVVKTQREKWKSFFKLKELVYPLIENFRKAKQVGSSSEIQLFLNTKWTNVNKKFNLARLFLIADVKITKQNTHVKKFNGSKCERCWNFFSNNAIKNKICVSCQKVISVKNTEFAS